MPKYGINIGKAIQKARKFLKLTQEELGNVAGLSTKYIQYLENGKRNPSLKTLRKLARHLKVGVKDLIPD